MSLIIITGKRTESGNGSDRERAEIAHKNAALWIQYSSFAIVRNSGNGLFDNGSYATVPSGKVDALRHTAKPGERTNADGKYPHMMESGGKT
jgi:hypothetical protein